MNNFPIITQGLNKIIKNFFWVFSPLSKFLDLPLYKIYTILEFDEDNDFRPRTNSEVQRKLSASKVKSIVNFLLNDPLAIFPTNLVIPIPNHVIFEQTIIDEKRKIVEIRLEEKVFEEIQKIDNNLNGDIYLSVIDGQHRVRGMENSQLLKESISTNQKMFRKTKKDKYLKMKH